MVPVGDLSWRAAAIYCNWLHNSKSVDRSAFLGGAYEVSTFGFQGVIFTDQLTRSPGAKYFIPSWDEWLKAVHFDPNKNGEGSGGWWVGPYGSDSIPVAGLPPSQGGTGQTNRATGLWDIPLGSYNVTTPWGLFDASGGMAEWTEGILQFASDGPRFRIFDGSDWSSIFGDELTSYGAEFPTLALGYSGFRIAAAIPTPQSGVLMVVWGVFVCRRSSRR